MLSSCTAHVRSERVLEAHTGLLQCYPPESYPSRSAISTLTMTILKNSPYKQSCDPYYTSTLSPGTDPTAIIPQYPKPQDSARYLEGKSEAEHQRNARVPCKVALELVLQRVSAAFSKTLLGPHTLLGPFEGAIGACQA